MTRHVRQGVSNLFFVEVELSSSAGSVSERDVFGGAESVQGLQPFQPEGQVHVLGQQLGSLGMQHESLGVLD